MTQSGVTTTYTSLLDVSLRACQLGTVLLNAPVNMNPAASSYLKVPPLELETAEQAGPSWRMFARPPAQRRQGAPSRRAVQELRNPCPFPVMRAHAFTRQPRARVATEYHNGHQTCRRPRRRGACPLLHSRPFLRLSQGYGDHIRGSETVTGDAVADAAVAAPEISEPKGGETAPLNAAEGPSPKRPPCPCPRRASSGNARDSGHYHSRPETGRQCGLGPHGLDRGDRRQDRAIL